MSEIWAVLICIQVTVWGKVIQRWWLWHVPVLVRVMVVRVMAVRVIVMRVMVVRVMVVRVMVVRVRIVRVRDRVLGVMIPSITCLTNAQL